MKIPWGNIGLGLFILYLANTISVFYNLYFPTLCNDKEVNCILSKFDGNNFYDYHLVASHSAYQIARQDLLYSMSRIRLDEEFSKTMEITLPSKFLKNDTVYGHVIIVPYKQDPFYNTNKVSAHYSVPLTSFKIPEASRVNLMEAVRFIDNTTLILHWKPKLITHLMDNDIKFDAHEVPPEFRRFIDRSTMKFSPILYIDQLSQTRRYDTPLLRSKNNLTITFSPISIGKLRIWRQFEDAVENLKEWASEMMMLMRSRVFLLTQICIF